MIHISILTILILPFLLIVLYAKQVKKRFINKLIEKHFLEQNSFGIWYSGSVAEDIAKQLLYLPRNELTNIIKSLNKRIYKPLFRHLNKKNTQNIKIILGKKARINCPFQKSELAILQFDYKKLENTASKLKATTPSEKARLLFIQAHIALKNGDLEPASKLVYLAIAKFRKLGFAYEEAQCYLLNGIIYRACGIIDTSQLMLQTAHNIFQQINAQSKQAETLGHLGMLMTTDGRFSDAQNYFNEAQQLFQTKHDIMGEASIINQQAPLALLTKNFQSAISLSKKAIKIYQSNKNPQGQAFGFDIAAQSAFASSKPRLSLIYAKKAALLYQQCNNISAQLEMLQLEAQIYIKETKLSYAEKILRKIISISQEQNSCFHIANAYNLLGIVYLKQHDFRRAEGIFQQALNSELYNERWCGAALDYANIAITSQHRGNTEQSKKCWQMAIQYAKQANDNELLDLIKKQVPNLWQFQD